MLWKWLRSKLTPIFYRYSLVTQIIQIVLYCIASHRIILYCHCIIHNFCRTPLKNTVKSVCWINYYYYLLIIFNYQNVEKGCLDNLKMLKFLGGACPLEPQTNDISKSFNTHLSLFGNAYNTFLISQQFQFLKQFLSTC